MKFIVVSVHTRNFYKNMMQLAYKLHNGPPTRMHKGQHRNGGTFREMMNGINE